MNIRFEWDEEKTALNLKKHKVSFEEAKTVFYDPNALLISDPEHSTEEDRFIIMGISNKSNVLVDTIRLDEQIIDFFKNMAEETGMLKKKILKDMKIYMNI